MADDKKNEKNEVLLYEGDGLMSAEELTKCKNAVCLIRCETSCPKSGKRLLKRGSGFYAKAKVFGKEYRCIVTNNHVISCEEDALHGVAIFHFEQENQGIPVQLRPNKLFRTNSDLDYSVIGVSVDEMNRLIPQVFPIQYTEQPQAVVGDDIFIFQHPMGEPKKFSYEKITHIQPPFVHYIADTNDGSSGSPVFWKLQLIAIHRVGSKEDGYNKGTLFSEVINDLHTFIGNNGVSAKRDFACVGSNSPKEMEENSCKRFCADNCSDDEMSSETFSANNNTEEKQPVVLDDKTLEDLSRKCSTFYKKLGRILGVKHERIEEISRDHVNYGSPSEKCYQVLYEWKESMSSEFTSETLENALRKLDKNSLADKYFGEK